MPGSEFDGWEWFQSAEAVGAPATGNPVPREELARLAARCFRGRDGNRLIGHLRALTLERALGPAAPQAQLRHLEGQRQLVRYLEALVAEGWGAPMPSSNNDQEPEGDRK